MKRKENFQMLPKELQLKYEAISVPQGSVNLVKDTRKNSTCYLLITKGVTSSSPVKNFNSKILRAASTRCWALEKFSLEPVN
ncbi:hypothetical protein TNCV_189091 [Trichonephila clavipes]|nr:hypothetical protein TNCV_189091 [Trichonephila clavipes]